ncbi:LysR family transcriptional regulator [Nocardia aobensis]|uniref:LysR family transcriptional regulator n=1 Tax=Nocardia aobensis TaxID=257277 RepID=A0ABW6PF28_9NOCA
MLPVLRALLLERSVTRAGEAVGLSQPATSAALARLRRRFGDELLTRKGRGFELTPFASTLLTRLEAASAALERLFDEEFDSDTTTRSFSVIASDYATALLGQDINEVIAVEGKGHASIELRQFGDNADIGGLLRQNDLVVVPQEATGGYPGAVLLHDRWVCIVAESNKDVGGQLTVEDLRRMPCVVPFSRNPIHFAPLHDLRRLGIEPNVEVVTDSFMSVAFLVVASDRVSFLQERYARMLRLITPIRILESPVDLGGITLSMRWHPTLTDDPAHRWMRQILVRAAQRTMERQGAERPSGHQAAR